MLTFHCARKWKKADPFNNTTSFFIRHTWRKVAVWGLNLTPCTYILKLTVKCDLEALKLCDKVSFLSLIRKDNMFNIFGLIPMADDKLMDTRNM